MIGTTPDFAQLVEKLAAHEAIAPMSAAVREAAHAAALARQPKFPLLGDPELAEPEGDPDTAWNTDWGNVWQVLRTGAKSAEQVALVEALLALGDRDQFPSAPESELNTAALVVWLAAHTTCNAFEAFDAALGQGKAAFWQAVGRLVVDPQSGGVDFGQTEALIAAVALRHSASPTAKEVTENLRKELTDPVLLSVLAREPSASQAPELVGELSPAPKGPVVTAVMAVTLILAVWHAARLIGRYAFAYRRPAKVVLSDRGLEVTYHTELLGKVLRERATLVPLSNLASVTREVRFARLGMYAGLVALVLGSYLGMGLFVDGVRVPGGSATLIGMAVLLIVLGLVIDFALSSLSDSVKGKCRLLVVPRKGRAVCIGALSTADADAVLGAVAEQVRV